MPKTFTPEQIVANLRQVEALMSQGKTVPLACKGGGLLRPGRAPSPPTFGDCV
jgi:hypothetical protein